MGRCCTTAMRFLGTGHILFCIGLAGLGVLSLASGDFAFTWQPVPASIPARELLARCSGILLLAGGIGMAFKRTAAPSALVMAIYLLTWVLFLQGPHVIQAPGNVGAWLGFCENTVLMSGGWILFASLADPGDWPKMSFFIGANGIRVARFLFGGSCLVLGLSHFVYTAATAGMVPAWLPGREGFAYLTGTGHIATGIAVLTGILPRLATTLEAIMISLFILLVHIPGAMHEPGSRLQWTMVFVASALAGAVWAIARSFGKSPWGFSSRVSAPAEKTPVPL